jgi:glutamyl-tRNA synthetase
LHVGGARTALFNFLLARGAGGEGRFILRIDDTDKERSRPEYESGLMEDLRWLGLDWDEGPGVGPFAPYRQSERLAFYEDVLRALRERDTVYPCFCSEERLEVLRNEQLSRGEPPRYDGLCRSRARRAEEKPCWRFALPDRSITFHDSVRGDLSFAPEGMGDFVVARSDGQPTYIFASVVDDRLMEITHIVRGDEHVPNTARQQAIFDALGWTAPLYAHIPMILSEDRQKLSKRTGSTPIRRYREEGYLPEALTAYLSTLSWTPPDGVDLLSLNEASAAFSLRISASSPVHDESHLAYRQKEAMKRKGGRALLGMLADIDARFGAFDTEGGTAALLARLIDDLTEEHYTLPMLKEALNFIVERPKGEIRSDWLEEFKLALRSVEPWNEDELNLMLRAFMKEHGLKGKEFFHPLRMLLTGRESGAALTLVMCALGKKEIEARMTGEE